MSEEKSEFILVPEDREFVFKGACPYCGGDLTYTCEGWEEDDNGQWMAESISPDCSSEPDMENEEAWDEWFAQHSDMPYVHQMPVDESAKEFINKKYRFILK